MTMLTLDIENIKWQ